jgi:hypothetical protein
MNDISDGLVAFAAFVLAGSVLVRLRMLEDRIKRLEQCTGAPDAGKGRSDVSQD